MTNPNNDLDRALASIASRTEVIAASPGFHERVFAGLPSLSSDWRFGVMKVARVVLAAASLSAMVCLGVALASDHSSDDTVAVAYGMQDLDL